MELWSGMQRENGQKRQMAKEKEASTSQFDVGIGFVGYVIRNGGGLGRQRGGVIGQ